MMHGTATSGLSSCMLPLVTSGAASACSENVEGVGDVASWRWDGSVPLARVLAHVRPAYGGDTWAEALEYLRGAPAENAVIEDLCARGAEGFDEPVRVRLFVPDDEDADDTDTSEGAEWLIGNGMHRVAAAVRLGHETITCTTSGPSEQDSAEQEYVDMTFTLPDMSYSADLDPADGLDALDWVCGWFRSFPLRDGTWVECDSFAGHGKEMTGLWTCPTSHAEALVQELHARWAQYAPPGVDGPLVITSQRTLTGAQWDAEFEAEFGDKYPDL